jgi:hypothetical protein
MHMLHYISSSFNADSLGCLPLQAVMRRVFALHPTWWCEAVQCQNVGYSARLDGTARLSCIYDPTPCEVRRQSSRRLPAPVATFVGGGCYLNSDRRRAQYKHVGRAQRRISYPREGCIRICRPGCFVRDNQTLAEAVDLKIRQMSEKTVIWKRCGLHCKVLATSPGNWFAAKASAT